MSYIERSRQNKIIAEKAAAFDKAQQKIREKDIYDLGGRDAYSAVEQEIMRKMQESPRAAPVRTSPGAGSGTPLLSAVGRHIQERGGDSGQAGLADTFSTSSLNN